MKEVDNKTRLEYLVRTIKLLRDLGYDASGLSKLKEEIEFNISKENKVTVK